MPWPLARVSRLLPTPHGLGPARGFRVLGRGVSISPRMGSMASVRNHLCTNQLGERGMTFMSKPQLGVTAPPCTADSWISPAQVFLMLLEPDREPGALPFSLHSHTGRGKGLGCVPTRLSLRG